MTLADMGHLGEILIGMVIGALALAWKFGREEQSLKGRVTRLEQWRESMDAWMERIEEKLVQYGQRQASMFQKLDNLADSFKDVRKDVRSLVRRRFGDRRKRRPRYDDYDDYLDDDEE